MSRRGLLLLAALLLLLLNVAFALRVVGRLPEPRLELGRVKLSQLDDATERRLADLPADVVITYYASHRSRMPSHMRRIEAEVRRLLEALERASGDRLRFQIVDPDGDEGLARYAARRGVAPFRARSVERDAYSERTVWSSLAIAYGPQPEVVLNGVGPQHLPRLSTLVLAALDQAERPCRPVVALAAPPGFELLAELLGRRAEVVRVDVQGGEALPEGADLLFWLEPRAVEPAHLRALDAFVEGGRSAVVAGSEAAVVGLEPAGGDVAPRFAATGFAAEALLGHFGLSPRRGLVLDARAEQVELDGRRFELPFAVRSIAPNQSFRSLRGQPNGHLMFVAPTPFAFDGERLARLGWRAEALATSSDHSALRPLPRPPSGELAPAPTVARLAAELAAAGSDEGIDGGIEAAPQLPLLVLLQPEDPWRGSLVFAAASTPFADEHLPLRGHAHARLVEVLLDNFTAAERLLIHRSGVVRPQPLPELSPAARAAWRALAAGALPALLLAVAAWRRRRQATPRRAAARADTSAGEGAPAANHRAVRPALMPALALVLALAAVLAAVHGLAALDLWVDLSAAQLAGLAPETRRLAAAAGAAGDDGELGERLEMELIFTRRTGLPPHMRGWPGRVRELLRRLERAGLPLSVTTLFPEDLDADGRARLAAEGVEPLQLTTRDEEETRVRTVYSALRLGSGERREVLTLGDAMAMESLELRLALALERLRTGYRPHVVVVSDQPRLTPAEAHEQYQTHGLFSPMGTDVYSLARTVVEQTGFRVTHVHPRRPQLPAGADLLVWLQPRRPVEPVLDALVRHLRAGGSALVAAQHFNIQPRQYRGTGFRTVYWPQPQTPEIDRLYLPEVGIHLVREVLFDELMTRAVTETQVARAGPQPEMERQDQALPFLLRASAANFAPHPITRGVGDQALFWPSYLRWDEAELARHGITATTLIWTSERTWSYAWQGGWIPDELLAGPASPTWLGRLPLGALFEGTFPPPRAPLLAAAEAGEVGVAGEVGAAGDAHAGADMAEPAPARLLLLGASEPFKNHRLLDPDFRADHLLINAVVSLTLGEEMAAVAARRPVPRGFDYLPPERRLAWRLAVLGGGALLPVLLGLALGGLLGGPMGRRLGRRRRGGRLVENGAEHGGGQRDEPGGRHGGRA